MRISLPESVASRGWLMMRDTFDGALETNPDSLSEFFYIFGGHHVRLRVVGRRLAAQITRPFSHLQTNRPTGHRLSIDLWDEAETGLRCPVSSPPGDSEWTSGPAISSEGRFIWQKSPNTVSCLDRRSSRIVGQMRWSDQVLTYELGKPLARPLLEWHNDRGVQVIHAGLVARDSHGILFAGKSGDGKSTCALACVCAGFDYLGEDFVGLERRQPDGSFLGYSLYNAAFVTNDHLARFPQLVPHATLGIPARDDKSVVILSQVFPERLRRVVPIRVLVLPRLGDASESRVRRASKGEALLALGPSSLLQIPSRGMGSFANLAALVERVPVYSLELGRDLRSIAPRVGEILTEATAFGEET